ncbi:MAG: hypothetical protein O3B41_06270 [Bacteroidetes bacterium]|nr:hypothetical protein [Bacteroidota bacterium]
MPTFFKIVPRNESLTIMKYVFCVLGFLFVGIQNCLGQSLQVVELVSMWTSKDSLQVTVQLTTSSDSLEVPIWAFQYDIEISEGLQFSGVTSVATMSEVDGWTTGSNIEKRRVAGFSSSQQAIHKSGPMITMLFVRSLPSEELQLCLSDLRLNSGDPSPNPSRPCISL